MPAMSPAMPAAIAASRRAARALIGCWRESAEYRALACAFADGSEDDPEPVARRAECLFGDDGWAAALLAPLLGALAEDPFFEPPFKVSRDALRIGAILFDGPAASITASVTGAAAMAALPPPATLVVSGRVQVTRTIKAGGATLRRWRAEPLAACFSAATAAPCDEIASIALADGQVCRCDGRVEAQLVGDAQSDVVTLVATIRPGAAALMREYAVGDRRLVRVASADDRASRTEMLLAFLRLSGRADAGAQFAAATHDSAFHLRWAAMREWLALDARAALPRLSEMAARDPHDEVRTAALRTLAAVERRVESPCRA